MNGNSKFIEIQRFNQRWLNAVLYTFLIISLCVTLIAIRKELSFLAFIPLIVMAGVFTLFKVISLTLSIDANQIQYRFKPFHRRNQVINKSDIKEASVVRYNPILQYGGWGIRYNFKRGKAFSTRGNYGLQIKLNNGRSILIGTQKPEELKSFLRAHPLPSNG
jgi:hypothetical protein